MYDYANVKIMAQSGELAKERTRVRSLRINPVYLVITVSVALFLYIIGYQNISIAQVKHEISKKQIQIHTLMLKQQQLVKKKQQIINYSAVLKDKKLLYATDKNIVIVR
ncbi:hypothetical protein [Hippea maritima]|uniref:Uncharacterized protein n=1 Tax=Hippea maritima (strain ATCC 700847 / DSM 10411 / MH2) TaxID=760142 RepID=F2LW63_HIPMA|nr:hypothetical protein [Hippea maritima]AEA33997.1 hypothetical protein Hipma_1031 [Hippea maritima DSM 10411]